MINFFDIENKYNVESIKYNGKPIWPILRVYIASKLILNKERIVIKKSNALDLLFSLPRGVINLIFTRSKFLAFSDTDRRVFLNGKYFDRLVDPIAEEVDMLIIETPLFSHYPRKLTFSRNLSSRLFLTLIKEVIAFLMKTKKIESEDIIIDILKELKLSINYKKIIRNTFAEELLMRIYLKFKGIKGVFLVVSYTKPGIILACKKLKIPVIELQHGIINEFHYAYNVSKIIDNTFYPDYLFTYGEFEKGVFSNTKNNFIKKENVIPVGNYLIDYYRYSPIVKGEFEKKTDGYNSVVALSGQVAFDYLLIPFLIKLAYANEDVAFVFIPRGDNYFLVNNIPVPKNVIFISTLNTYDIIRRSNFHATISSTCSIEALCLGIPNIFININNWSIKYYEYLKDYNFNYFIDTVEDFSKIVNNSNKFDKKVIINQFSFLIKENYKSNLQFAIKRLNLL